MGLVDLTYYRQLQDYAMALESWIRAATGLSADRVVFSPPNIAKRKLKEKLAVLNGDPAEKTVEIDQFVSFYFPFGQKGVEDYRQSPQASFWGSLACASKALAHADYIDLGVEIDTWAGPDQRGKEFLFNVRMALQSYMFRHRRIRVAFRDLVTKNPENLRLFDVNCWYEIEMRETLDHSEMEELFNKGVLFRSTFEFVWFVSFYRAPLSGGQPVSINPILRIIGMFASGVAPTEAKDIPDSEYVQEWVASTSTTTSTSTSTSSSTSSTTSTSSSSSSSSTTTL